MTFDIIEITDTEVEALDLVQVKMLRTAQQKKNVLDKKYTEKILECEMMAFSNGVYNSSILETAKQSVDDEYNAQVEELREQLLFNMNAREPTHDDETGGSGTDDTGYVVDYELSYLERYIQVRDYYLSISDPYERLTLYEQDEVAIKYLRTYYNNLYDYLMQFAPA